MGSGGTTIRLGHNGAGNGCPYEVFQLLAKSPSYRTFAVAFKKATGLSLRLAAVHPGTRCGGLVGRHDPKLCRMLGRTAAGRTACEAFARQMLQGVAARKGMYSARCFAGLVETAVPIFSGGEHVATLLAGKVSSRFRRPADWRRIAALFGACGPGKLRKLKQAFQAVPGIEAERVKGACSLLKFFGKNLEERIPRWVLSNQHPAPAVVSKAKEYILKHATESITLSKVARCAGVSKYYLCQIFKQTTGMTFKAYLAHSRVEKAKALLHENSHRIVEIAFASGFGSVATFNRVFKRFAGQTPTRYRQSIAERG